MTVPLNDLVTPYCPRQRTPYGWLSCAGLCLMGALFVTPLVAADLRLSLKEAIDLALSETGSLQVQMANERIVETQALSRQTRADLLPDVEAFASQREQTTNLEALGLRPTSFFRPPNLVGPFSTFDARASLSQTIFDLPAIRRLQASRVAIAVSETEKETTGDRVAGQVARSYLETLREQARVEAAQANAELAEALVRLAKNQKSAGTGTAIEVTRAQVQLSNQQQLLLAARHRHRQALLRLVRAIGVDLSSNVTLTETLSYVPVSVSTLQQATAIAWESRSDLQTRFSQEEQAKLNYQAARWERLPSVRGFLDYGTIGSAISNTLPTWLVGVSVDFPVFDGGRTDARRTEFLSRLRRQRLEIEDLRQQIELEVRVALDGLLVAQEEIRVAEQGLRLAQQEVEQGERRYRAGVTTSLEVTDAQTRLERAQENHITALFNYNLQRVNLAEAMGTIRSTIP